MIARQRRTSKSSTTHKEKKNQISHQMRTENILRKTYLNFNSASILLNKYCDVCISRRNHKEPTNMANGCKRDKWK